MKTPGQNRNRIKPMSVDTGYRKIYRFIRDFLFSVVNKEFLIFLFFFALSGVFWLLMALNETYEKELRVPVRLTGIPKNAIITGDLSDTIRVTVRDKGFTLMAYSTSHRLRPLSFSFASYAVQNTGRGVIPVSDVQKQLYQQLYGSSRITGIKPDRLDFFFNYGLSKRLPIRMAGKVVPAHNYYLSRFQFWPEHVTVYADKHTLDSLKYVTTTPLDIVNFEDTVTRQVTLKPIHGVKIVPSAVKLSLYPDILTEENVEVPVVAINMPAGKVLRTFPSRVKVHFTVGVTKFRSVKPEQFMVVADYNELLAHPSDKCNLYLRQSPPTVSRARLAINRVDYLIEQQ